MRVRELTFVVACAGGCFSRPDGPQGVARDARLDDTGMVDGRVIDSDALVDGALASCIVQDMFTTGTGCGAWGAVQMTTVAQIGRVPGELKISSGTMGGTAACTATQFTSPTVGAVVQITEAAAGMGAVTRLKVTFDGSTSYAFALYGESTAVFMGLEQDGTLNGSEVQWNNLTMDYFWIHVEALSVVFETGHDGINWTVEKSFPIGVAPTSAIVELSASFPDAGTSRFDNLDACP